MIRSLCALRIFADKEESNVLLLWVLLLLSGVCVSFSLSLLLLLLSLLLSLLLLLALALATRVDEAEASKVREPFKLAPVAVPAVLRGWGGEGG